MEPRTCPTCGSLLDDQLATCASCGAAVAPDVPARAATSRRRPVVGLFLLASAVLAIALAWRLGVIEPAATAGSAASPVITRVPATTVLFAEARLDQPGDQAANLKALLARFPAVGTGPTSSDSLADDVNQVVSMADGVYAWDLKADVGWVGRDVAIAVVPGSPPKASASVLAFIDVADVDAAMAWLRDRASAGRLPTPESTTYHGATILVERASDPSTNEDEALATVLDGRILVVGHGDAVRAAIDTTASASLATTPGFVRARAALGGDALAVLYLDVRGLAQRVSLGYSPTGEPGLSAMSELLASEPDWIALRLRAERDSIRIDKASPPRTGGTPRRNVPDTLASRLPAGTLEVTDLHDLGLELQAYVNLVRSTSSTESVRDLERTLEVVGGLDAILAPIDTLDLVTITDGDRLLAGVVARTTDDAATSRLIGRLADWARSSGYSVTTEEHAGVTITDIDPRMSWSILGENPFIQLATRGDLFVAGFDRGFATAILDVDPASSLAMQPRYQRVMALAGMPNAMSCYADLAGILEVADRQAATGDMAESYRQDVRPWLAPLDTLGCAAVNGDPDRASIVISVREVTP